MKQYKDLECFLKKAEGLDWNFSIYDASKGPQGRWHTESGYVELGKYSPTGEYFCITIDFDEKESIKTFLNDLKDYMNGFDPEEYVEMLIENNKEKGLQCSIRDLLDDSDAVKKMLYNLYGELSKIL